MIWSCIGVSSWDLWWSNSVASIVDKQVLWCWACAPPLILANFGDGPPRCCPNEIHLDRNAIYSVRWSFSTNQPSSIDFTYYHIEGYWRCLNRCSLVVECHLLTTQSSRSIGDTVLWQSTLAEYGGWTLCPGRFGMWTRLVLPIKDFTMYRRRRWHGGLTPPRETTQQVNTKRCYKPLHSMDPVKQISYQHNLARIWPRSGNATFIIFYIKGPSLHGFLVLIAFPNSTAAFVTSSELTNFIWYSFDLKK